MSVDDRVMRFMINTDIDDNGNWTKDGINLVKELTMSFDVMQLQSVYSNLDNLKEHLEILILKRN